uniref:Integrase catalytic domain-containing protein n=1 Tax=Parascaris univalens TaxID=6257 RepID=A0A915BUN2_PARUN
MPQGRATVKRILRRHCMAYHKWNAKPFKLPAFPPLPKERTWATRAFQNVGLDYMRPITVRDLTGLCKRWIALFTCLATRAIHLEVTKNLSAEQFLHVLRRSIARNGYPTSAVLDNVSQFQLVKQVMQNTLAAPITAPRQGGVHKRLVALTKIFSPLFATFALTSSVPTNLQFHVCAKYGHGLYVKIPDKLNCKEIHEEMHSPSQIVEVLSRAFITANATFCAKVSRTVCTKCFLRWSLAVRRDETTVQNMTASQCMEMRRSQLLSGTRLEQIDANRWLSKQSTEYSYGWIESRCHRTTNYHTEQGVIGFFFFNLGRFKSHIRMQ